MGSSSQVVTDQRRNVGVDHLVVGHPRPGRVGDGDVAGAPGPHEPLNADQRIGPELLGIEENVVDPAVDDVDPDEAGNCAHVNAIVRFDNEVLALHEMGTHLLGEESVLEVGRVEDARASVPR